jgi:hypothetical protein
MSAFKFIKFASGKGFPVFPSTKAWDSFVLRWAEEAQTPAEKQHVADEVSYLLACPGGESRGKRIGHLVRLPFEDDFLSTLLALGECEK